LISLPMAGMAQTRTEEHWHPFDRDQAAIRRTHRRLGPLWFGLYVPWQIGIDSQPFGLQTAQQDTFFDVGLRISSAFLLGYVFWLRAEGGIGYTHYFKFDNLRRVYRTAGVEGALRLPLSRLRVQWSTRRSRLVYLTEIDFPVFTTETTRAVDLETALGHRILLHGGWSLGTQRFSLRMEPSASAGEIPVFVALLDRDTRRWNGGIQWHLTRFLRMGLEGYTQRNDFRQDTERNSREWGIFVSAQTRPMRWNSVRVAIGYMQLIHRPTGTRVFAGWFSSSQVDVRLLRRFWILAQWQRGPRWSLYIDPRFGQVYIENRIGGGIGVMIVRGVRITVMYTQGRAAYQDLVGRPRSETSYREEIWQVGLDVQRRWLAFGLRLQIWQRTPVRPLAANRRWMLVLVPR